MTGTIKLQGFCYDVDCLWYLNFCASLGENLNIIIGTITDENTQELLFSRK